MTDFLVHDNQDNVGVVVKDIKSGDILIGKSMDQGKALQLTARQDLPLGHKIALKDLKTGGTVIKYGEDIGRVVVDIRAGEHVHIHNLKTKRW